MMSGLMALALGLGVSGTAFAYQGDLLKNKQNSNFEYQISSALNNHDYDSWKNLVESEVGNTSTTETITKDNFHKFTQAWKLANEGKIKEANKIRRELEHSTI